MSGIDRAYRQFKFYDDEGDRENLAPQDKKLVTIDTLRAHMDPFYRECRAYGRLIDAEVNGEIAVRCHGYLTIPAAMEDELAKKFQITTWDRSDDEYDKPVSKREPLRAIVKDLIDSDVEFVKNDVYKILRHLKHLHRLGIYPMDVTSRNYRAGSLVDFSAAMTEPHYLFQTRSKSQVVLYKQNDFILFDRMVKNSGIQISKFRATRNEEYLRKLRKRPVKPKTFIW